MPGARNKKRYQDVEELLNAGIDVVISMSVQHLESLKDAKILDNFKYRLMIIGSIYKEVHFIVYI